MGSPVLREHLLDQALVPRVREGVVAAQRLFLVDPSGVVRMVAVGGPGAGDHDPPDTCLHARGGHVRGPGDIDAILLLDVATGIDDGCQMHDRVDRVPSQERGEAG